MATPLNTQHCAQYTRPSRDSQRLSSERVIQLLDGVYTVVREPIYRILRRVLKRWLLLYSCELVLLLLLHEPLTV